VRLGSISPLPQPTSHFRPRGPVHSRTHAGAVDCHAGSTCQPHTSSSGAEYLPLTELAHRTSTHPNRVARRCDWHVGTARQPSTLRPSRLAALVTPPVIIDRAQQPAQIARRRTSPATAGQANLHPPRTLYGSSSRGPLFPSPLHTPVATSPCSSLP
jgi:hypothetical protein